ncbi:hypothetical protein FA95DRAFT_1567926 [Auriscalpium vulgare]|uniref:Uncharacterized protein n=1 Tax=Auriscalpium vulgare TaxID=40419 RepID=A0ACB8R3E6_9AGAM|nr:hypothetical protein FA95DRAFT_1567926 [Auriscalpium vulgare]
MTLTQGANAFDPFESVVVSHHHPVVILELPLTVRRRFVAFSTPATPAHHWSTWPGSPSPSPTGFPDPDSRRSLERDIVRAPLLLPSGEH